MPDLNARSKSFVHLSLMAADAEIEHEWRERMVWPPNDRSPDMASQSSRRARFNLRTSRRSSTAMRRQAGLLRRCLRVAP